MIVTSVSTTKNPFDANGQRLVDGKHLLRSSTDKQTFDRGYNNRTPVHLG
jgi:hypothetical protein